MMKVLILFYFFMLVSTQCPDRCRCPSQYVASCRSLAINYIPHDRFDRYVEFLDVSDNVLRALAKTELRDIGVISLIEFNASKNYIAEIDREAFLGQSKLKIVDLSFNNIGEIEPETFQRNPYLELLILSNNPIILVPEFIRSTSLIQLHLSECNLYTIPEDTFKALTSLQKLYINKNKISSYDNIISYNNLRFIDLSNNKINYIYISTISMNLTNNIIKFLNITTLQKIINNNASIDFSNNPWYCDCAMKTTYIWTKNNSIDLDIICTNGLKWELYNYYCNDTTIIDDIDVNLTENVAITTDGNMDLTKNAAVIDVPIITILILSFLLNNI